MRVKCEKTLAGIAIGATILTWFALGLMVFYVPRLAQLWAELEEPLSVPQRLLLDTCHLIQGIGILVIPALLAATIGAIWWRLHAGCKARTG